MSSYFDIFYSSFQTAIEVWPKRGIRLSFLSDFMQDMKNYGRISTKDAAIVCVFAIVFTLLRWTLTKIILTPFAVKMKFTPKNIKKFPESLWKFTYYLVMYTYTCILLFGKNYPYFEDPKTCWSEWSVGLAIPSDIYYLYSIQASFYIHSIYATLYMDPWRNDSIAMIIHHILTVFLLCFSFAVRYYKVGVVVLFLHDICDVLLEFTKLCVCWKTRDKKEYYWPEVLINITFVLFAAAWFYCRLYLFPYKVLYPGGYYAVRVLPHAPFYYFFNGLLMFLFAMDVWWFHYIILLIWRVLTGQSTKVEDTREVGLLQETETNLNTPDMNGLSQRERLQTNGTAVVNGKEEFSSKGNDLTSNHGKINDKGSDLNKEKNGLVKNTRLRHRESDKTHEQ